MYVRERGRGKDRGGWTYTLEETGPRKYIHEVDKEGAILTAGEEEAGNDVGGVSIGRSK